MFNKLFRTMHYTRFLRKFSTSRNVRAEDGTYLFRCQGFGGEIVTTRVEAFFHNV